MANRLHPVFDDGPELIDAGELDLYSEEERKVLRWRLEQFSQLGFKFAAAALLAVGGGDLSLARKLVARGCPLETASQILL